MSDEEEAPVFELMVPNLDIDSPALSPDQIKMAIANHALILRALTTLVNGHDDAVTTLTYVMAAYMKQYPLDLEKMGVKAEPELPGQYL